MSGAVFTGEYPEHWPELSHRVKEQARWRCVRCGHRDEPAWCRQLGVRRGEGPCDARCEHPRGEGKRRVLTVHHLDGDKGNERWWNLVALCQVCHLYIQGRVQLSRQYLWAHTPWFRPYVAGYYASAVLGEELSREEVESRLGELLSAGQPHLAEVYEETPRR